MTHAQATMLAVGLMVGAVAVTLLLFVTGVVVSGAVHRMVVAQVRSVLDDTTAERDYYRSAAQSCASAVAEAQAQINVMMAAMRRMQRDGAQ